MSQRQPILEQKEKIILKDNNYLYYIPVFKDEMVVANIVVTLDFEKYIFSVLNKFYLDGMLWQWILNEKGSLISANIDANIEGDIPEAITSNLSRREKVFVTHTISINGKEEKLLSACSPILLLGHRFGIIFSLNNSVIFNEILKYILIAGLISFLILAAGMFLLLNIIFKKFRQERIVCEELEEINTTIDNLPIGVMILDGQRRIKTINKNARNLLFIKSDEDLVGKDISDRFLLSKNYFQEDDSESAYDSNQFILYQREGNEVVVYKKESAFILNGEDVFLEAFLDVTAIEKSRKYEAAANTAKSEFLAKMSHEIRTPMNGIVGMTEALDQESLTKTQKEYIQILRKSADLLLNIIDDILVLSNLISNAVKFTHEGKIIVDVQVEEEYSGNLTLQISVEDTGVGIPKHKLESIFNSFTQAEESTSRKYGGSGLGTTIAKQLVTLMNGEMWVQSPSTISKNPDYPGSS